MNDLFDLTGPTDVVTGASSGLGCRSAEVLTDAGATVYGVGDCATPERPVLADSTFW